MEQSNIRPFLIGICGGSLCGKNYLLEKIAKSIDSEFKICKISMVNYYKNLSNEDYKRKDDYNFDKPDAIDFNLLFSHLNSLLNKKPTKLPKYDISTCIRQDDQEEVNQCHVIMLEGIFAFYEERIRNLMDLKIFIDVDKDIQLSRIIYKDIFENGRELENIIRKYHKYVKPSYTKYILPTRKYADIILQKPGEKNCAGEIVSEYLRMQLSKMVNNQECELFSFINEIIDPKYQYFDGKILVESEKIFVPFIKEVFQDFIVGKLDADLIPYIREKMVNMLFSLLIRDIKKKMGEFSNPEDLLLLSDEDNLEKYNDFKSYKNIYYFKTVILSESDIEGPQFILTKNKDCNLVIFSIILAPKYADLLLSKEITNTLFSTIYFSDFFIKFEKIIKGNEDVFNDKEFKKLFFEKVKSEINYASEEDFYDLKIHDK
jgi:uridine kinase